MANTRAVLGSTSRSTAKHRDNTAPCLSSTVEASSKAVGRKEYAASLKDNPVCQDDPQARFFGRWDDTSTIASLGRPGLAKTSGTCCPRIRWSTDTASGTVFPLLKPSIKVGIALWIGGRGRGFATPALRNGFRSRRGRRCRSFTTPTVTRRRFLRGLRPVDSHCALISRFLNGNSHDAVGRQPLPPLNPGMSHISVRDLQTGVKRPKLADGQQSVVEWPR